MVTKCEFIATITIKYGLLSGEQQNKGGWAMQTIWLQFLIKRLYKTISIAILLVLAGTSRLAMAGTAARSGPTSVTVTDGGNANVDVWYFTTNTYTCHPTGTLTVNMMPTNLTCHLE
ncbi:MAG TPA: hypothetical protein DCZ95_15150, partial [Verrucomicrobia bacterium]|nr:hypothetical protein [Verrucomicrobiota bacterium]